MVTYTATVNADAVIGGTGNTNEATLSYGETSKSTSDKTTTYVYELYVYKYTTTEVSGTATEVALSDAKFVIYKEVNGTNYYAVLDNSGKVSSWTTWLTQDDIDTAYANGELTDSEYAAAVPATELTTDSTGVVYFGGLDAGSYFLLETAAPNGYNKLAAPTEIEIGQDGTTSGAGTITYQGSDVSAIKIYNGSSTEMPSTGGGTTIFYIVGSVLVLGAIVLLVDKFRMCRD
ncbi:MAG: hypothetical protein LUD54_02225 [Oscillospiraceae bacterium]|nr:hypothetical protein [Oscillospiraceae bacterium]